MKILGRELSRLEQWTSIRQKARSILSVFVDIISWGHICTDRLFDDYSAGSCFFQGQRRPLRYIQSENALDFTTSITVLTSDWSERTLYVKARSSDSRKHAESES